MSFYHQDMSDLEKNYINKLYSLSSNKAKDAVMERQFLKQLWKAGYHYLARDKDGSLYAFGENKTLEVPKGMYPTVRWTDEESLNIAKELGIVNWEKVHADTLVLVSNDEHSWKKRYFKKYDKDYNDFIVYAYGCTSNTIEGEHDVESWKYCKVVS